MILTLECSHSTFNLMRELGGMKVAISDNAQGRNSRTIHTLAIAARESHKPVPFSYRAISRTPVKLPQQKYSVPSNPKNVELCRLQTVWHSLLIE